MASISSQVNHLSVRERERLLGLLHEHYAECKPMTMSGLAAYVESDNVSVDEIRQGVSQRLPDAVIPSNIRVLATLPRLPNGKIDRERIPTLSPEPVPMVHQHPLAKIWADLLPGAEIEPTAHFFNSGGHSLMVLQLVERIEKDLDVRLRPVDIFQNPIYAEQLRLLDREQESIQTPVFRHVVHLRKNGSKPPLFLVKTGALGPILVKGLNPEVPVHVLRGIAHRQEGNWRRWGSMRELAEELFDEVKRVQAKGPYFIGGYSMGGPIAWELALLMAERGEHVPSLLFFDPAVPNLYRKGPLALQLNRADRRPQDYRLAGALACWLIENHPFGQRLYRKLAHRFLLMPWRRHLVRKANRLRSSGALLSKDLLEADFSLASYESHNQWQPQEYSGRTLMIYSTQTPFNTRELIEPWFTGDFQAEAFDAGHLDMTQKESHCARLLELLNREVQRD